MVEGGGAVFPVVYFDGEHEINMGDVRIRPSLQFKDFQSHLSQMIGISPNQITVYLVDSRKTKSSTEFHRKIPVTAKMNFAAIANEKNSFFLVVSKRSRRNRRPKLKQYGIEYGDYSIEDEIPRSPEKFLLLRRNQSDLINPDVSGYLLPRYDHIAQLELADFSERLRNFQIQRDNYARMMNSNMISTVNRDLDSNSFPSSDLSAMVDDRRFCEECANASKEGIPAPFHLCVFDAVIDLGFRSPAGPIDRPRKAVS